jgi:hypothetical protein
MFRLGSLHEIGKPVRRSLFHDRAIEPAQKRIDPDADFTPERRFFRIRALPHASQRSVILEGSSPAGDASLARAARRRSGLRRKGLVIRRVGAYRNEIIGIRPRRRWLRDASRSRLRNADRRDRSQPRSRCPQIRSASRARRHATATAEQQPGWRSTLSGWQCAGIDRTRDIEVSRRRPQPPALRRLGDRAAPADVKGRAMMHKFERGQLVRFAGGYPYRDAAEGFYQVMQLLPNRDGEYQYRIKSEREPHERVANESELHQS